MIYLELSAKHFENCVGYYSILLTKIVELDKKYNLFVVIYHFFS